MDTNMVITMATVDPIIEDITMATAMVYIPAAVQDTGQDIMPDIIMLIPIMYTRAEKAE